MDKTTTTVTWQGAKKFVGSNEFGREFSMNFDEKEGIKPMQMALLALGGCTAIDVINTLEKMRQKVVSFSIEIEGARREEHPRYYEQITIVYKFEGDLERNKVERAVRLSKEKYCSVSNMFEPKSTIDYRIEINNQ